MHSCLSLSTLPVTLGTIQLLFLLVSMITCTVDCTNPDGGHIGWSVLEVLLPDA
jgi:hypothetical protein